MRWGDGYYGSVALEWAGSIAAHSGSLSRPQPQVRTWQSGRHDALGTVQTGPSTGLPTSMQQNRGQCAAQYSVPGRKLPEVAMILRALFTD
jgi:hypothetical protein